MASIPKGELRQELASTDRIMSLRLHMSPEQVKQEIGRAFNTEIFTCLECDNTRHNLVKAAYQYVTGEDAVGRKGCLYLCERFPKV